MSPLGIAAVWLTLGAAPKAVLGERIVLERFPAEAGAEWALVAGPCPKKSKRCPLALELIRPRRAAQRVALDWDAEAGPLKRVPAADGGAPWWRSSRGDIEVSARPVRLEPGLNGALVTLSAGGDHTLQRHALFVPGDKGPSRAWHHEDPDGPWTSQVTLEGTGKLLLNQVYFEAGHHDPDQWSLDALEWDPAARSFVARPLPPLYASILGSFNSVNEARETKEAHASCLSRALVLGNVSLREVPVNRVALAIVGLDQGEIREAGRAAAKCAKLETTFEEVHQP